MKTPLTQKYLRKLMALLKVSHEQLRGVKIPVATISTIVKNDAKYVPMYYYFINIYKIFRSQFKVICSKKTFLSSWSFHIKKNILTCPLLPAVTTKLVISPLNFGLTGRNICDSFLWKDIRCFLKPEVFLFFIFISVFLCWHNLHKAVWDA